MQCIISRMRIIIIKTFLIRTSSTVLRHVKRSGFLAAEGAEVVSALGLFRALRVRVLDLGCKVKVWGSNCPFTPGLSGGHLVL